MNLLSRIFLLLSYLIPLVFPAQVQELTAFDPFKNDEEFFYNKFCEYLDLKSILKLSVTSKTSSRLIKEYFQFRLVTEYKKYFPDIGMTDATMKEFNVFLNLNDRIDAVYKKIILSKIENFLTSPDRYNHEYSSFNLNAIYFFHILNSNVNSNYHIPAIFIELLKKGHLLKIIPKLISTYPIRYMDTLKHLTQHVYKCTRNELPFRLFKSKLISKKGIYQLVNFNKVKFNSILLRLYLRGLFRILSVTTVLIVGGAYSPSVVYAVRMLLIPYLMCLSFIFYDFVLSLRDDYEKFNQYLL